MAVLEFQSQAVANASLLGLRNRLAELHRLGSDLEKNCSCFTEKEYGAALVDHLFYISKIMDKNPLEKQHEAYKETQELARTFWDSFFKKRGTLKNKNGGRIKVRRLDKKCWAVYQSVGALLNDSITNSKNEETQCTSIILMGHIAGELIGVPAPTEETIIEEKLLTTKLGRTRFSFIPGGKA